MTGNIVIAIIVIVLLLVLAIIGYLIYRLQSGFSRGRGGNSETSGQSEEELRRQIDAATRESHKHEPATAKMRTTNQKSVSLATTIAH
ncbi:hypothetical protein Q7P37_000520 [Cladosporium fusiforme]